MLKQNESNKVIMSLSLCPALMLTGLIFSSSVFATDPSSSATATVHVSEACSLTSSVITPHTDNMGNGTYTDSLGSTKFTVKCNDASGFALYAIGYSGDEYGATSMLGDNELSIPTGTDASAGNTTSHWSMKISKDTTSYLPNSLTIENSFNSQHLIPSTYTKIASFPSSTDGINGTGSSILATYGVRISGTQAAGTYIGKVKFTLVHPSTAATPIPPSNTCNTPVPGATYMQEITASNRATILAGMTTGNRYYLRDSRDGKPYCVGKLADGNLWMLDNLALDIVATDLNTLKGNTNASDTTLEYLKGISSRNAFNDPNSNYPTSGVGYSNTNNYYSIPKIAISGDCNDAYCVNDPESGKWASDSTTTGGNAQGKIGIYYNYCAASAGSYCYGSGTNYTGSPSSDQNTSSLRDVTEDICPSGWRLPTSDTYGEFKTLYNQYTSGSPSQIAAFQTALSTPLSGYFRSGKAYKQGDYGYFWSSTWSSAGNMSYLRVNSGDVGPYNSISRDYGFSVRCLLGS